ncbi:MAG: tetratricopeptide repeat protein [Pirellulales bacterium]
MLPPSDGEKRNFDDPSTAARTVEREHGRQIHVAGNHSVVTFNRDVAPIVFRHCSPCHRPGEAAPFPLLSYGDFKRRAKRIGEAVARRSMPPWMPAEGLVEFAGERRLSDVEIDVIQRWISEGTSEGDERDRPPAPAAIRGWSLGKPDLVVKMPEPFVVPPVGPDVYRNFVAPAGLPDGKWVKGVHVRTGGGNVVHHGFVFVDPTGHAAKRNDAAEAGVGYSGMDPGTGVQRPLGQALSWHPGKQASMGRAEMSWWLPRRADLVLQMHIRPTGKEEQVQAEAALYFSETPPTLQPSALMLRSVEIDIPAGVKDYAIESSYVLPVDVEVISVMPHAHYLCRKVMAWAILPDEQKQWLLRIDDWDFAWQEDYRYRRPIKLPAGTRLSMRIEYDNSEDNLRNPIHPPKRVTYGLDSSDEMGEFHLQVLTRNEQERRTLETDYRRVYATPDTIAAARALLKNEPESAERMVRLGVALLAGDEVSEALRLFDQAIQIEPTDVAARYHRGHAYAMQKNTARAVEEWQEVVRIDPRHFRAQNNLGYWHYVNQDLPRAEEHLRAAVEANENDVMSRINLARVHAAKGDWANVAAELAEAQKIEPQNEAVRALLQSAQDKAQRP